MRYRNIIVSITFRNVRYRNIAEQAAAFLCSSIIFDWEKKMTLHGMFFLSSEFYDVVRKVGGTWSDTKERPIVCLIKSSENEHLYWAIPVGNWNHRNDEAQKRIMSYINEDSRKIQSCFYHLGKTTVKSIFFMSDVVPITDKYIDRDYLGYDNQQYIILNPKLIAELERKLWRILKYENSKPNYFRQHITDVKNFLLSELDGQASDKEHKGKCVLV